MSFKGLLQLLQQYPEQRNIYIYFNLHIHPLTFALGQIRLDETIFIVWKFQRVWSNLKGKLKKDCKYLRNEI